jgi:hypothetical protein
MTMAPENYLQAIAQEIRTHVDRDRLPKEGNAELLFRSYAVLALVVGAGITGQDVHDAWVAWMLDIDPSHPALIPFAQLDAQTAAEDAVFVKAIQTAVRELALPERRGNR